MLRLKTPKVFTKFDEIYVLTGTMVINTTKSPMTFYNQNNFGDMTVSGKYKKGFWRLYYIPYGILLKRFKNAIKKSNITFVSNSQYAADKLEKDFGKKSKVEYPTIDMSEFYKDKKQGVITVSRFSPEKNLEFTLDVFKHTGGEVYANLSMANKPYFNNMTKKSNIKININCERKTIIDAFAHAKVYFHSSVETFGITVVEAMASGCIPIVPDNSAHRETVPFEELRYIPNSLLDATQKVMGALEGRYDYLLPKLNTERFAR